MPRSDWAAWVQAIGTIAALAIAIAVPICLWRAEISKEKQRKIKESADLCRLCGHLARELRASIEICASACGTQQPLVIEKQEATLAECSEMLRSIPLTSLPFAVGVFVASSRVICVEAFDSVMNFPKSNANYQHWENAKFKPLEHRIQELIRVFEIETGY